MKKCKLKNGNYIDSSAIMHDDTKLSEYLNGTLCCKYKAVNDLNDLSFGEYITYSYNSNILNKPVSNTSSCFCINISNTKFQIVFTVTSNIYIRCINGNTWNNWKQIV